MARRSVGRRIERWAVGIVMGVIAFVLEKMVLRSVRRSGKAAPHEELHTTLTSKGGEVDLTEGP